MLRVILTHGMSVSAKAVAVPTRHSNGSSTRRRQIRTVPGSHQRHHVRSGPRPNGSPPIWGESRARGETNLRTVRSILFANIFFTQPLSSSQLIFLFSTLHFLPLSTKPTLSLNQSPPHQIRGTRIQPGETALTRERRLDAIQNHEPYLLRLNQSFPVAIEQFLP